MVNLHFKQTVTQQMGEDVKWQVRTRAMVDHGMKRENWRVMLLESGCTVRLIQEPTMRDNPLEVMWSTHGAAVTKAMIQILEGVQFFL